MLGNFQDNSSLNENHFIYVLYLTYSNSITNGNATFMVIK